MLCYRCRNITIEKKIRNFTPVFHNLSVFRRNNFLQLICTTNDRTTPRCLMRNGNGSLETKSNICILKNWDGSRTIGYGIYIYCKVMCRYYLNLYFKSIQLCVIKQNEAERRFFVTDNFCWPTKHSKGKPLQFTATALHLHDIYSNLANVPCISL